MIIYDRNQNRYKEIYTNRDFTLDHVQTMLKASTKQSNRTTPKYKKVYARDVIDVNEEEEEAQDGGQVVETQEDTAEHSNEQLTDGSVEKSKKTLACAQNKKRINHTQ